MNKTYNLKYSKEIVTRAVRSYFYRKLGIGYFIALILLSGYLVYEIVSGNRSWLIGLIGAVIGFGLLIPIAGMLGHIRIGLRKLAEMADASASLTIMENGIAVRSAIGTSEITWKTITEAWQYQEYWVVVSGGHFLMTIPLSELGDEGRAAIRDAFERAKVKMA